MTTFVPFALTSIVPCHAISSDKLLEGIHMSFENTSLPRLAVIAREAGAGSVKVLSDILKEDHE